MSETSKDAQPETGNHERPWTEEERRRVAKFFDLLHKIDLRLRARDEHCDKD